MPLCIKDDTTAGLVAELARKRSLSKQEAVRQAMTAELARIAVWRREHPLPPPTGLAADKACFDDLSGLG